MKKSILFILVTLAMGYYAVGQTHVKEHILLKAPEGIIKLNQQQYKDAAHQKYDKYWLSDTAEHLYKKNGILLAYHEIYINDNRFKKSLEVFQKQTLGLIEQHKTAIVDFSRIDTINNIRFLITEYRSNDVVNIHVISEYNKDNIAFNGLFQFEPGNEKKAMAFAKEIMADLQF